MAKQVDRLFDQPHDLNWSTSVLGVDVSGTNMAILPLVSLAEPLNAEGGDSGIISWRGGQASFSKVEARRDRSLWYSGAFTGSAPQAGDQLTVQIDGVNRLHNAGYHSFSHLLTAVFRHLWKDDVIATSRVAVDHGELVIKGQSEQVGNVSELWSSILRYVGLDSTIAQQVLPRREALALAGAHFELVLPKFVKELRVVHVGEDLPWIPCRGVHLKNLRQIGSAKLLTFASTGDGDLVLSYSLTLENMPGIS